MLHALIRRNGCGKTTLFRLANGLYRPSAGTILRQLRQQVGPVFQNPEEQLVAATVEEDFSDGLRNLSCPAEEIRPQHENAPGLERQDLNSD